MSDVPGEAEGMRVDGLTVGYGDRDVFSDLSVAFPSGRFTAVVGPNGCGKSTLLRSMVRLLQPREGAVRVGGVDLATLRPKEVARQIAFLPQESVAPESITVRRLVTRGRFPHQGLLSAWTSEDEEAVDTAMRDAGVTDLSDRPVEALSGGQRQRVWVAMVLAQGTPHLLLDEPTTFLDIAFQVDLLRLLRRLTTQGRTVVAVLHDINQACRFADHVVVLREGRVATTGVPGEVIDADVVERVFDLPSTIVRDPVAGSPMVVPLD